MPQASNKGKKSATQWNEEGLKLFEQREYQKALECFIAASEINPRDPSFAKNVGETFYRLGEIDKAITNYRKAIRLDNQRADFYNDLGNIFEHAEQFRDALSLFSTAANMDPSKKDYFENTAKMLRKIGEDHQALRIYQRLTRYHPKDASLHNNVGILYFHLQSYGLAFHSFKIASSLNPNNITYSQNLADALRHMGRFTEAIDLYKDIILKHPDDDLSLNFLGVCYLTRHQIGDIIQAKKVLKRATELKSDNGMYWMSLGQAYRLGHNFTTAIAAYKKALQFLPNNYLILNNIGLCYYQKGEIQKAKEFMARALEFQPNDQTLIENYIEVLIELELYPEAFENLEKLEKIKPFDGFLKHLKGKCLKYLGRYTEAEQLLIEANVLDPNTGINFKELVSLYIKTENQDKIIAILQEMEQKGIKQKESYVSAAKYFQNHSDLESALMNYKRALTIDPTNPELLTQATNIAFSLEKYEQSMEFVQKYIQIYPNVPDAYFKRSKIWNKLGNMLNEQEDIATAERIKQERENQTLDDEESHLI